jgi:hypothetical protein
MEKLIFPKIVVVFAPAKFTAITTAVKRAKRRFNLKDLVSLNIYYSLLIIRYLIPPL